MPSYDIEEVKKHNRADDFWCVVDNEVFDLTDFHARHPGGSLIISGAGSDCTVMYHNYHVFVKKRAKQTLRKFKIGDFEGKSPVMGAYYEDLSDEVAKRLGHLPKHPLKTKLIAAFDLGAMASIVLLSTMVTTQTPLWKVFALWCPLFMALNGRCKQEGHAIGHLQVFPKETNPYCEAVTLLLGVISMLAYSSSDGGNMRSLINEPREKSQAEFLNLAKRGPYEHQAIHHVKGASLEHDGCLNLASLNGAIRLTPDREWKRHHAWQTNPLLVNVYECFFVINSIMLVGPVRFKMGAEYAKHREWRYAALCFLGVPAALLQTRLFLLPLWMGWLARGLWLTLFVVALRTSVFATGGYLFFAQHVWDRSTPEEIVDTDWGRYNNNSSFSLWNNNTWNPTFWFAGGACPATLSYHCEHTLFPGINYSLLPQVAKINEEVCAKHGLPYNKLDGLGHCKEVYDGFLEKYSKPPSKKVD